MSIQHCHSLRNVVIPASAQVSNINCFEGYNDLRMLFDSQKEIESALKSRFVGLPVHELCYFSSQQQAEVVLKQLNSIIDAENNYKGHEGNYTVHANQDCLGMTPLHILACSTKHDLGLFQSIMAHHPGSIITEDKWVCLPILYAIWSNASHDIVQLLVDA